MKILITILIINTLIAILFLIVSVIKKQGKKGIVSAIFICMTPIVGALCLIFAQFYNWIFDKRAGVALSIEELSMSTDRVNEMVDINIQVESDIIPLRESIKTVNNKDRRRVLLEILKRDKDLSTLGMIKEATQDEDTEVSHYAITYVTDITGQYRKKEEDAANLLKKIGTVEARVHYIECLCEILLPKYFTEYEQEKYLVNLDEQIKMLLDESPSAVTGLMLKNSIDLYEQFNKDDMVEQYILYAKQLCRKDLIAAKICLQHYFRKEDKVEFSRILRTIKNSSLEIDDEVLEWIRFYNIL